MKLTKQALKEMIIEPVPTTLELHKQILDNEDMNTANYDIKWLCNMCILPREGCNST